MNCDELLKALNEYVDGNVDPAVCKDFEQHLAGCNPCQVVVDNIRGTIQLYKAGEPYACPPELCKRLRVALRARWAEKFAAKSPPAEPNSQ